MDPPREEPNDLEEEDGANAERKRALASALAVTDADWGRRQGLDLSGYSFEERLASREAFEQEQATKREGSRPCEVHHPPQHAFAETVLHTYGPSRSTYYMEWNNFRASAWGIVKDNKIEITPRGVDAQQYIYGASFDPWTGERLPSCKIIFRLPSWLRVNDNAPVAIDAGRTGLFTSSLASGLPNPPVVCGNALGPGYVIKESASADAEDGQSTSVCIELQFSKTGGYVHMRLPHEDCRVWPRNCLTAWDVLRMHKPFEKLLWVLRWMRNVAKIQEERRIEDSKRGVLDTDAMFVKSARLAE
jgi:hypothetical protein